MMRDQDRLQRRERVRQRVRAGERRDEVAKSEGMSEFTVRDYCRGLPRVKSVRSATRKTAALGRESDGPGRVRLRGPLETVQVAALLRVTHSRIRQIEGEALRKIRTVAAADPELRTAVLEVMHG